MLISNSHYLSIKSNTITNNQIGILPVLYSSYLNISRNTLTKNVIGVLPYLSSNNTIFQNNFYKNLINAFFKDCENVWINNYWGRPRFFPKPIFGLVKSALPYPRINVDIHPAQKPFEI
jgi:parallel beta-helix repeat protein